MILSLLQAMAPKTKKKSTSKRGRRKKETTVSPPPQSPPPLSEQQPVSSQVTPPSASAPRAPADVATQASAPAKQPAATKESIAGPVSGPDGTLSVPGLWKILDRELRVNIGTSVECGICLSTVVNPVRTPCVHSFCRDCISASLHTARKCPECNFKPVTRRSLQPFGYLEELSGNFKDQLVEFGFCPSAYEPEFTTLTQWVLGSDEEEDDDDTVGGGSRPGISANRRNSPQRSLDRLNVATAWQEKALPQAKAPDVQVRENQQVIKVNQSVCRQHYFQNPEALFKAMSDVADAVADAGASLKMAPAAAAAAAATTTTGSQEQLEEQAREQLAADLEWQEQLELQEQEEELERLRLSHGQADTGTGTQPDSQPFGTPAEEATETFATPAEEDSQEQHQKAINADNLKDDAKPPAKGREPSKALSKVQGTPQRHPREAVDTEAVTVRRSTRSRSSQRVSGLLEDSAGALHWTNPDDSMVFRGDDDTNDGNNKEKLTQDGVSVLIGSPVARPLRRTYSRRGKKAQLAETGASLFAEPSQGKAETENATQKKEQKNQPPAPPTTLQDDMCEDSDLTQELREDVRTTPELDRQDQMELEGETEGVVDCILFDNGDPEQGVVVAASSTDDAAAPETEEKEQSANAKKDIGNNKNAVKGGLKAAPKASKATARRSRREKIPDLDLRDDLEVLPAVGAETVKGIKASGEKETATQAAKAAQAAAPPGPTAKAPPKGRPRKGRRGRPAKAAAAAAPANATKPSAKTRAAVSIYVDTPNDDPPLGQCTPSDDGLGDKKEQTSSPQPQKLAVGSIVNVESRTWPGVNKHGGVGRVINVNHANNTYDVAYVLGGKEHNIDAVFVSPHTDETETKPGAGGRRRSSDSRGNRKQRQAAVLPKALMLQLEKEGFDVAATFFGETVAVPTKKRRSRSRSRSRVNESAGDNANKENIDPQAKKPKISEQVSSGPGAAVGKKPIRSKVLRDTTNRIRPTRNSTKVEKVTTTTTTTATTTTRKRKAVAPVVSEVDDEPAQDEAQKAKRPKTKRSRGGKCDDSVATTSSRRSKDSVPSVCTWGSGRKSEHSVSSLSTLSSHPTEPLPTTPIWSDEKEACSLADARYCDLFEKALQEKVVYVIASGLSDMDLDILCTLCAKKLDDGVKLKFSDSFGKKTTVCVTPLESGGTGTAGGDVLCRNRTLKTMRCAVAGVPIVSMTWVQECLSKNRVVLPTRIARSLPSKALFGTTFSHETQFGVARLAATAGHAAKVAVQKKSSHKALYLPLAQHYVFLVGGASTSPAKLKQQKDLRVILKEAGAKILSDLAAVTSKVKSISATRGVRPPSRLILLCLGKGTSAASTSAVSWIPDGLTNEIHRLLVRDPSLVLTVNPSWVVDSVTCAKSMPADAFKPDSHLKAELLWKRCLGTSSDDNK